jgi:hypothetical protein
MYASLGTKESGVVEQKIEDMYVVKNTEEMAELGLQLMGKENSVLVDS